MFGMVVQASVGSQVGNCTTGLGSPALLYTSPRHMFHGRWSMLLYSLAMNLLEQYKEPDATVHLSASASQKTLPVSAGRPAFLPWPCKGHDPSHGGRKRRGNPWSRDASANGTEDSIALAGAGQPRSWRTARHSQDQPARRVTLAIP